jgi:hypothetical protein
LISGYPTRLLMSLSQTRSNDPLLMFALSVADRTVEKASSGAS